MKNNPTSPTFDIELKGKTYTLHFARSDYADAEWALKQPLISTPAFFEEVLEFQKKNLTPPVRYLEIALFVGLQRYITGELTPVPSTVNGKPANPIAGFSFRDLRDYVAGNEYNGVFVEVMRGLLASMPEAEPEESQQEGQAQPAVPLAPEPGGTEPGPSASSVSG